METKKEIINEAVRRCQGKGLRVGMVVAHPSDEMTYGLEKIQGDTAVFKDLKGRLKYFPLAECFDPNECKRIALCLLNGLNPDTTAIVDI